MSVDDQYSDILGGSSLPIRRDPGASQWSGLSFTIKTTFTLALVLVLYVASVQAWDWFLRWREQNYKLSMRRKHGIPDSDKRLFAVAHAAVIRSRQDSEREAAKRQFERDIRDQRSPPAQGLRQRPDPYTQRRPESAWQIPAINSVPGGFSSASDSSQTISSGSSTGYLPQPAQPIRVTFADGYNTSNSPLSVADQHDDVAPGPSNRPARRSTGILKTSAKRALDGEGDEWDDADHLKKSRVEGEELIDGDEDPVWQEGYSGHPSKRGSKRSLRDEDVDEEEVWASKQREKRRRNASLDNTTFEDANMDEDIDEGMDVDEVREARTISRGKKRDRAEATYDQEPEAEAEGDDDKTRQRKRRNKRKSDTGVDARGKKRERDAELSDEEEATATVGRKKRGKKNDSPDQQEGSDVSMDDASPQAGKRKIGEEYTSNGISYKIGPNGQRLRLAYVKESRPQFDMPADSMHPDRDDTVNIYLKTWLTEDEYKDAKAHGLLLHQNSRKDLKLEIKTPSDEPELSTPSKAGKHLLWDATSSGHHSSQQNPFSSPRTPISTPIKEEPRRLGAATAQDLQLSTSRATPRRIAFASGLADNTNGNMRRQLSKWEKQDLEAKAMMRVREAQKLIAEAKDKTEKEKAPAPPSIVPTISLTKPSENPLFKKPDDKPAESNPLFKKSPLGDAPPLDSASKASTPSPFFQLNPSSVPKLSFPSSVSTPASTSVPEDKSQSKPAMPSFALPTPPASQGAASPFAPPQSQNKPNAPGFGFPPSFSNPAPSAGGTPASNSEAKPVSSFAPISKPSSSTPSSEAAAPGPSAPKFSFGMPGGVKPSFGIPPSSASNQSKDNNTAQPSGAGGNSLMQRMGGLAGNNQSQPQQLSFKPIPEQKPSLFAPAPAASATPTPTPGAAQPAASSAPKFNFGFAARPASATPTPAAATTTATPSSLTGAWNPNSAPATNTQPPAFSFGTPPVSSTPTATPTATASNAPSDSGGLKFKFAAPAAAAPVAGAAPKSAFGAATGGASAFGQDAKSPFGNPASNPFAVKQPEQAQSAFGAVRQPEQPKSAFGGSGASSSPFGGASASPFGAPVVKDATKDAAGKDSPAPNSMFGGGGGTGAFGAAASSSPFSGFGGSSGAATPQANKPTSTFGTGSAFGAFGAGAGASSSESKDKTGFGGTSGFGASNFGSTPFKSDTASNPSTSTPAGEPPKTSFFNLGGASTPNGGSTTPQSSPFSAFGNKPSGFTGFGNSTTPSSTPPASNVFGAPSNAGQQSQ